MNKTLKFTVLYSFLFNVLIVDFKQLDHVSLQLHQFKRSSCTFVVVHYNESKEALSLSLSLSLPLSLSPEVYIVITRNWDIERSYTNSVYVFFTGQDVRCFLHHYSLEAAGTNSCMPCGQRSV